jgi:hypothetical protein
VVETLNMYKTPKKIFSKRTNLSPFCLVLSCDKSDIIDCPNGAKKGQTHFSQEKTDGWQPK